MKRTNWSLLGLGCALLGVGLTSACGDDSDGDDVVVTGDASVPVGEVAPDAGAGNAADAASAQDGSSVQDGSSPPVGSPGPTPLYVMMSQVYDANGDRTIFYPLSNTLDPVEKKVTLANAQQAPGVANLAVIGGKVFLSAGTEPRITRYSVSDDFQWKEEGSINFAQYGLAEDGANFYNQFVLDAQHVYLPFEITQRIVWNPETLSIVGTFDDSMVPAAPAGMTMSTGGNRTNIQFPGHVRDVFSAMDGDYLFAQDRSFVVTYDPATHRQKQVVEVPVSSATIVTADEQGNSYYSTYGYTPVPALYGLGHPPRVARLDGNFNVDPAFTTDFTQQTGGRYVVNFRYLRDGFAVAGVLHHERFASKYDFKSGAVDPKIWDDIYAEQNWGLWIFNVKTGTATEVPNVSGYYFQTATVDGRAFVMIYSDKTGESQVYELGTDGALKEHIKVVGDFFKWLRVR